MWDLWHCDLLCGCKGLCGFTVQGQSIGCSPGMEKLSMSLESILSSQVIGGLEMHLILHLSTSQWQCLLPRLPLQKLVQNYTMLMEPVSISRINLRSSIFSSCARILFLIYLFEIASLSLPLFPYFSLCFKVLYIL